MRKLQDLDPASRLWIYQANRKLSDAEVLLSERFLEDFLDSWVSHGKRVLGAAEVRDSRFILIAGQVKGEISGCSIDSSVAIIKQIQDEIAVDFFDRQLILFKEGGETREAKMHEFWAMRKAGVITDDHLVFNNLVDSVGEIEESWVVPFAQSWHAEMW